MLQLFLTMWCCAAVFDGDNVFLHGADRIAHGLEQETGSKWRGSYFMPAQADRWRSHMRSHGLRHGWHSHRSVIRRIGAPTLLAHWILAVRQILQVSAGCILHADADSALPELTLLWAWPCEALSMPVPECVIIHPLHAFQSADQVRCCRHSMAAPQRLGISSTMWMKALQTAGLP